MRVALCTFFGAQRHCHDIPAGRPAGAGAGPVMPGAAGAQDHRRYATSILSRPARPPGPMWDLGNTALSGRTPLSLNTGYSGWRSGTSFQGAPGLRPQAAAANAVNTKSRNVMTCTLVQ